MQFLRRLIEPALTPEYNYLNLLRKIKAEGNQKQVFSTEGNKIGIVYKEGTQWQWEEENVSNLSLTSLYGETLKFDLRDGKIPLLTTKNTYWQGAFKEMLWFIEATGDVAKLHQQKVPFWTPWAYKYHKQRFPETKVSYSEFQAQYLSSDASYVIPIPYTDSYRWDGEYYVSKDKDNRAVFSVLDQSRWVIDEMQKKPDRKSYKVSAWNPARLYSMANVLSESESVVIAACHDNYQLLSNLNPETGERELTMVLSIRSQDLPIGSPINIAQYGLLTHLYAQCMGMSPKELIIHLGDVHIYSNEWEGVEKQLEQVPQRPPTLEIKNRGQKYLQDFRYSDFKVNNYNPQDTIPFQLTVVGGF